MQSQMIGLQSSLDRILSAIQNQVPHAANYAHNITSASARDINNAYVHTNGPPRGSVDIFNPSDPGNPPQRPRQKSFPPLPGFAPPVSKNAMIALIFTHWTFQPHKYATYGIVPSTAPSSDDESEDTLPRSSLNAPIEALQGLANAAAEAAATHSNSPPR